MNPFYKDEWVTQYCSDALTILGELEGDTVDLLATDPPYGIGFMGKDWDKALPDKEIWSECLRVLKPGSFAFVMSIPRADCLSRMIISLEDAGFRVDFSPIYHTFASGFPKAQNIAKHISKAIDNIKREIYNSSIWNTNLNSVKSVGQLYLNELIEAGLLITSKDFVAGSVIQHFKARNINALVSIVGNDLSEALPTLSTNIYIVPENVVTLPRPKLSDVHIVELGLTDRGQKVFTRLVFVPIDVQAYIYKKVESKIKEGVAQRTESGKTKSWNEMDINALCAEVIEGLRLTTLSQLKNILSYDTKSQMELPSATNVIITKSIKECLLTKTASILGKRDGMGRQNPEWNGTAQGRKENSFNPEYDLTAPSTPQAKALDGSYGGFQPKPAVEVIIVCMKPLSEKTFVDQALKNGKGITWLDDCRIPYESEVIGGGKKATSGFAEGYQRGDGFHQSNQGRFPANLLISDDVLNDGRVSKSGLGSTRGRDDQNIYGGGKGLCRSVLGQSIGYPDSGSFSRYFDLDKWAQTLPFLIVPKASKSEKNKGCEDIEKQMPTWNQGSFQEHGIESGTGRIILRLPRANDHPTVKPLKLMSYLITLGSRSGDTVLDPFGGSGTTALASKLLGRKCIISEIEGKYCEIAAKRCSQSVMRLEI